MLVTLHVTLVPVPAPTDTVPAAKELDPLACVALKSALVAPNAITDIDASAATTAAERNIILFFFIFLLSRC
jgi:hypothetical protein